MKNAKGRMASCAAKCGIAIAAATAACLLLHQAFRYAESLSHLGRIRWLMATVSVMVALVTIMAIRSYKLREKYAVLWLTTSAVILFTALFPQIMDATRHWFGMEYATSMVAVVFVFLLLVVFHFSIALSALNDKMTSVASKLALLERRVRELETGRSGDAQGNGTRAKTGARPGGERKA